MSSSSRLRAVLYRFPQMRLRMALLGGYTHWVFWDWNEGNVDRVQRLVEPEVHTEIFVLGTYRGPEGMVKAWSDWQEAFGGAQFEVAEVIDRRTGEIVIATRITGHSHSMRHDLAQEAALVWTLRSGSAIRVRIFPSKEQALNDASITL